MQRRLIETMTFPASVLPVNLAALADTLADRHHATIVGSDAQLELRFGDPSTLVVVISSTKVEFFEDTEQVRRLAQLDDEDPAHRDVEEDSAAAGAESAIHTIEEVLGLFVDDDGGQAEAGAGGDAEDRQARRILDALLDAGAIELATRRARAGVEGKLAHLIARGLSAARVLEGLVDHEGVAEIYADEAQIRALLASTKRRR